MDRKKWASALCAAAAIAAVGPVSGASAAVSAPHNVTALYNTSGLELSGYPAGAQLTAQVVRNGVTIGTASGAADAAGILDVNPTACWDTWTPEILPGDTVRVSGAGVADSTVVQNVTAGAPVQSGADIVVHGTASDAAGNPLPLAEIENRLQAKSLFAFNGRKTLRAAGAGGGDGTIGYDAPGSTAWAATYSGLGAADQQLVLGGAASNASAVSVSIDDTNPATAPLVVSGTLSAPTGAQTWTASVPAAQLAGLSDGTLTATATYTIATGTTTGVNLTIPKDTVAPPAPTASPAPGLFSSTQSLTLSDADATAKIRYTTDGTAPSPTSTLYGGPITGDFSRTIKAV